MKKSFYITLLTALILCFAVLCCAHAAVSQVLVLPEGTKVIEAEAFYGDTSIREVVLPEGVESIGERAFAGSGVTKVNLPKSLTYIAPDAFDGCDGVTLTIISGTLGEQFAMEHEFGFLHKIASAKDFTITKFIGEIDPLIIIPDTIEGCKVTAIGDHAFDGIFDDVRNPAKRTQLILPDSITHIGDYAFNNCGALLSIVLPDRITHIGDYAFANCHNVPITLPNNLAYIGSYAFESCMGLSNILIPGSVTHVSDYAFIECLNLKNITIQDGVTSIGSCAFAYCTGLTSITIPDSVTTIGELAFWHCTNLTSISLSNKLTTIENDAFSGCTSLTSITIPDSVTTIGEWVFAGCTSLTSVFLSDKLTSIDDYTFDGCTGLTSITIPNSVTTIGEGAFRGCTGLTNISIPDSVATIGEWAFNDCTSLTSISIPDSVTTIGYSAFSGCTSLKRISLSNHLTEIAHSTFEDCTSLNSIIIPDSVTSIDWWAFENCSNLVSITIPDSVTSISRAFNGCTRLTSVTMPVFGYIDPMAFQNCPNLNSITITEGDHHIHISFLYFCPNLSRFYLPDCITNIGDASTISGSTSDGDYYYEINIQEILQRCPNLTFYGEAGSYAETYAAENNIPFISGSIPGPIPSPGPDDNTTITLSGYVQNASGAPIESVYVSVITPADDSFGELTMTNRNGYWSVSGLPAGNDYTVIFSHADYDFGDPITNPQEDDAPVVGRIKTSGTSDVSFTMQYEPTTAVDADILVGDSVSFVVTANDATKIRLVVDGALYNEYPVKNGQAVFSRTFTMSGQRSIAFQAYDGENWGKICTAQTLVIGEYGKLTAPVVHSIDTQYVDQPFTLSWNPVENAQSYTVYLYKDSLVWPTRSNTDVSTTQDCSIQIPGDALYITGDYQIEVIAAGYGYSQATGKANFTVEATNAGMEITYPRNGATYDVGDTMHTQYVTSTGVKSVRLLVTPPSGNSNATLLAPGSDDVFYPVATEVGTYTLTPYYSTSADGFENISEATAGESITVKVAAPAIESLIQGPNKTYAIGFTNTAFDFTGTLSNSRYSVSVTCNGSELGIYTPNQNGKFTYSVDGLATDGEYNYTFTPCYGDIKGKPVTFPVYEVEKVNTETNKFAAGAIDVLSYPDSPVSLSVPYGSAVTVLGHYKETHLYVSINGNNYFVLADCALADAVEIADITIGVACLREDDLPYNELNTIRQYRVTANGAVSVSATVTTPSEKMTCTAIKKDSDFLIYIPVEEAGGYSCIFTVVDAAGLSKDTNAYVFAGVDTSYEYAGQECWSNHDQYLDTIGYEEGYSNVDQIDAAVSRMFCIGKYNKHEIYVHWQTENADKSGYAILFVDDMQFVKNTTTYRALLIINPYLVPSDWDYCKLNKRYLDSVLSHLLCVKDENIFTLLAESEDKIVNTIIDIKFSADWNDITYIYWSGHGNEDVNKDVHYSWSVLPKTKGDYTAFEYEIMRSALHGWKGKINMIIDCCYAEDFISDTYYRFDKDKQAYETNDPDPLPESVAILFSSSKGEKGTAYFHTGSISTKAMAEYVCSSDISGLTLSSIANNIDVFSYNNPTATYWGDPNRVFFAEDPDAVK